jgi:hypothetical protein
MRRYQCRRCRRVREKEPEQYVAPPALCKERVPYCYGLPMGEMID